MDSEALAGFVDAYRRDGYVRVPGVLSAEEVVRYGAAVDLAVARRTRADTRSLSEKTPYEQSFIQCQYLWEDFPDVRPLTFHPAIGALAAALTGRPVMRLWHDQALYKEAGGRETDPHQDQPYWPIAELDTITAWIPLMDVDEGVGCMGYVPGSHQAGAEFVDIFTAPGSGASLLARQARPPRFEPCSAGDVIFHHGQTVHLAGPNRSAGARRVYTAIYLADGSSRSSARPHPSVDRDAIAPGAVIAGVATPISWPLPGGRRPTPAPWPAADSERLHRWRKLGVMPGPPA